MDPQPARPLPERLHEILRHTVGNDGRKTPGFRNYYCVTIGTAEEPLLELTQLGLMRPGREINMGLMRYYHTTVEGFAIGCGRVGIDFAAWKAVALAPELLNQPTKRDDARCRL